MRPRGDPEDTSMISLMSTTADYFSLFIKNSTERLKNPTYLWLNMA